MGWTARRWERERGNLDGFTYLAEQYLPDDIVRAAAAKAFDQPVNVSTMHFPLSNVLGVAVHGDGLHVAACFTPDLDDPDVITSTFKA